MTKPVNPATTHRWVGAATIPLTPQQAKTADLRGSFIVKADSRITVVEAYCESCRRPYEDCADTPCLAADPRRNEHLRGGPIGERKKRGLDPAPPVLRPAPLPPPRPAAPPPQPRPRPVPPRPAVAPPAAAVPVPAPARPSRRRVAAEGQLDLFADAS